MGVDRRVQQLIVIAIVIGVASAVVSGWMTDYAEMRRVERLPVANLDRLIPPVKSAYLDSGSWVSLQGAEISYVPDSNLAEEAYQMEIFADGVVVRHGAGGDQRAAATWKQLTLLHPQGARLPIGTISDVPAFPHRGVLLDVCRHFFTVEEVKRQLDLMHLYKFNTLHWHLTEDQGWRLAMEAYPKLAEIAAYRSHGDSLYGGFYTRAQLEEVVHYASTLGITVIPEIEMPGHSQAALAAYPHLGCTGEPVDVATEWGVFKEIYCAGSDSTFAFLEDVLDYVCEIFPSKYIHLGGDEAPKFRWEHCPKCQQRMRDEGLENEEALQRYFISRIERYLAGKGRQIIGWDEILEGGLSPNATVQSWRGFEGAIAAAEQGHDAIVSPTSHAYFDYPISSIDVPKVYSFRPIPDSLDPFFAHHILGGECNLWSERIPDAQTLDRRFLPRGIAMAEVLWSNPEERDYPDFQRRLSYHYAILDTLGYQYDVEQVPVELMAKNTSTNQALEVQVQVAPKLELMEFTSTLNGEPTSGFTWSLSDRGQHLLTVQPRRNGRAMGPALDYGFALHEGLQTHSCLTSPPTPPYTGQGDIPLANGRLGSLNFRDGQWLGFFGPDAFSGHFDWEEAMVVDSVKIRFLQSRLSWILVPEKVIADIYVEDDVIHRTEWFRSSTPDDEGTFIETMVMAPPGGFDPARSIYFSIPNTEHLPENHPAAGQPVWHFLDEVQIYAHPYRN